MLLKRHSTNIPKDIQKNKQYFYSANIGKYYILDPSKLKIKESNILGKISPSINLKQVGKASYTDRVNNDTLEPLIFNLDKSQYHPQTHRFEGYSQFPRPLVSPFKNDKGITSHQDAPNFLKLGKTRMNSPKNKNLFDVKINKGLHYFSGTCSNVTNLENKAKVIDKINKTLKEDKQNYKIKNVHIITKLEKINLLKYKNRLMNNSVNKICGRELSKPPEKAIESYNANYNIIKNKTKINHLISDNIYDELYNSINNSKIYDKDSSNNKNKNINFNLEKELKKSFHICYNLSKITQSTNNDLTENSRINSYSQSKTDGNKNIKIFNTPINKFKLKDLERIKNINKNIDDFSFDNVKCIKTSKNLRKNYLLDKKYLNGFTKPISKETRIIQKKRKIEFNNVKDIYLKEFEIYKKLNPEIYKFQQEKEDKYKKFCEKRLLKLRIKKLKTDQSLKTKSKSCSNILNLNKNSNII